MHFTFQGSETKEGSLGTEDAAQDANEDPGADIRGDVEGNL